MTYPKTLPPHGERLISTLIKRLPTLAEGETIVVPCLSAEAMKTTRYYLYAYLHNSGQKDYFRIRTLDSSRFSVLALPHTPPQALDKDFGLSAEAEALLTSLIAHSPEDTGKVTEAIRAAKASGAITPTEAFEVHRQWIEFHGGASEVPFDCRTTEEASPQGDQK